MDGNYLPIAVHNEYARRMEDEHTRQNHRIKTLEDKVEDIGDLTASVSRLAQSIELMAKTQEKQGKRLEALEQKPAKRWDSLVDKIVWAIAAALISFMLAQIGL